MKLCLKNFRQDVDISDTTNTNNALVFVDEDSGKELVVPVQFESVAAIAAFIGGARDSAVAAELDEPEPETYHDGFVSDGDVHPDVEAGADEFPPRPELVEPIGAEEEVPPL